MRLVAYGEHLHADGLFESFVLTDELDGYDAARPFPRPAVCRARAAPDARRDPDLGRAHPPRGRTVARRFHAAGYNHRDLYCCHFFVKEPEPGRFEIRLIDLQRVQRRRRFRRRWIVKDLAQLAYSAPRIGSSVRTRWPSCGTTWACGSSRPSRQTAGARGSGQATTHGTADLGIDCVRIGLVIEQFDPAPGRPGTMDLPVRRRLVRRGHEVHVVADHFSRGDRRRLPIVAHRVECAGSRRAISPPPPRPGSARWPLDVIHDMGCGWYCDVFQPHGGCACCGGRAKPAR